MIRFMYLHLPTLGALLIRLSNADQPELVQRLSVALAQHWPRSWPGTLSFLQDTCCCFSPCCCCCHVYPPATPALPYRLGVPRVPVHRKLQLFPHLPQQRLLRIFNWRSFSLLILTFPSTRIFLLFQTNSKTAMMRASTCEWNWSNSSLEAI